MTWTVHSKDLSYRAISLLTMASPCLTGQPSWLTFSTFLETCGKSWYPPGLLRVREACQRGGELMSSFCP